MNVVLVHSSDTAIRLIEQVRRQKPVAAQMLFPIDSTVVTLTSQLFWLQGYHQVKLLNGVNLSQGNPSECLINFGQGHDAKFADFVTGMIPEDAVGIMDRGFASWELLDFMSLTKTKFVVRIKNNMKTELNPERYRIVWFCDRESRSEFRLATNVDEMTHEEVSETYRHRWQIEVQVPQDALKTR
ncbi:MAG: transposase [Actinomycetota bacterium]